MDELNPIGYFYYSSFAIITNTLFVMNVKGFGYVAFSGGKEIRTPDPLRARQVLSQLSYTPKIELLNFSYRLFKLAWAGRKCFTFTARPCNLGSSGLEPPTSRLSGVCSNQLSYEPKT